MMTKRENTLRGLLYAVCLICIMPCSVLAAEEGEVPYPPRTFLYIADCSGSMGKYKEALETGRQMICDLLPENTTVVAFRSDAQIVSGTLSFGGETSVLSGIELADEALADFWQKDQEQKVTAILFSDMDSTVEAADGKTYLQDASFRAEAARLRDIEQRWLRYDAEGKLNFYLLCWNPEKPEGYPVSFMPIRKNMDDSQTFKIKQPDSAEEILKTCVEAYSRVLTGSDVAQWCEADGRYSEGVLSLPLTESYRTFLYIDGGCGSIDTSVEELREWHCNEKTIVMLNNTEQGGECRINDISADSKVSLFCIPQPQVSVEQSAESVMCYDTVTFSVGTMAGEQYIGYAVSDSNCSVKVTGPDGEESLLPLYNEEKKCYEIKYTPQKNGEYEFSILYLIKGDKPITRKLSYKIKAQPYEIVLHGQAQRGYQALCTGLQRLQAGTDFSFCLSDYYTTPYRRLEFIVDEPESSEVAVWDPVSDEKGEVTIRPCAKGSTKLHYTICYYEDGDSEPDYTVGYDLEIDVAPKGSSEIPPILIAGTVGAAIILILIYYFKKRKIYHT